MRAVSFGSRPPIEATGSGPNSFDPRASYGRLDGARISNGFDHSNVTIWALYGRPEGAVTTMANQDTGVHIGGHIDEAGYGRLGDVLERMIDLVGLPDVLGALEFVCAQKADHVASNWQDASLSKAWERAMAALEAAEAKIRKLGIW